MPSGKDEDTEFDGNDDQVPPAIPDGDHYEVVFSGFERKKLWGSEEKIFLHFILQTPGPFFGDKFYMACTVAHKGKWRPSFKYWLAWVLANGKQPLRGDWMSTRVFRNKIFRARFRKVLRTSSGLDRTPDQQYSVIDQLLQVIVG